MGGTPLQQLCSQVGMHTSEQWSISECDKCHREGDNSVLWRTLMPNPDLDDQERLKRDSEILTEVIF